ncbi:hypothetical protein [Nocardiopsis rhodophaea]|uniref:hypothetical protein n=1 Tax=Nocardiopsis rhodophaea TaxID=280238 RepID=UPI0031D6028D
MPRYGREDEEWEQLVEAGLAFLIERAQLRTFTTYTELNAALVRRTGLRGFDFGQDSERAAVGDLLATIVERELPKTGLMLSALVRYLDRNDAGTGFYKFAEELGLLERGASSLKKEEFWFKQVNELHGHYAR